MLKKSLSIIGLVLSISIFGQEGETIGKTIDDLTYAWDLESTKLDKYDGFRKFCGDAAYRGEIIEILNNIHHYDSILYDRLSQTQRFKHSKEIAKTLKDIRKFEKEYDMKSFLTFLKDECVGVNDIEKHKKDLVDEIGQESYDGRKYILITEIAKYIHHITKRVDLLREHVHHLHIK